MVFFEVDSRQYIPCAFMKEGSEKKKKRKNAQWVQFSSKTIVFFLFFSFLAFFRIWNPFEKYLCALSKYYYSFSLFWMVNIHVKICLLSFLFWHFSLFIIP